MSTPKKTKEVKNKQYIAINEYVNSNSPIFDSMVSLEVWFSEEFDDNESDLSEWRIYEIVESPYCFDTQIIVREDEKI